MSPTIEVIATHVVRMNILWAASLVALWVAMRLLRVRSARVRYDVMWLTYVSLLPAVLLSAVTSRWFSFLPGSLLAKNPTAVSGATTAAPAPVSAAAYDWTALAAVAGCLAIAGALTVFAAQLLRLGAVRRALAPCQDARILAVVEAARRAMSIRRSVTSFTTARRTSPFSLGARRPTIVFPDAVTRRADDTMLELIAAHEMTHIRHHDFLRNLLQKTVRALFAFNPVVWIADRYLDELREVACDQDVLTETYADRRGYAQTLLDMNLALRDTDFAAGMALLRRRSNLKRRIAEMKRLKTADSRIKIGVLGALLTLTVVVLACSGEDTTTATAPVEEDTGDVALVVMQEGEPVELSQEVIKQMKLELHEHEGNAYFEPGTKLVERLDHDKKAYFVHEVNGEHQVHELEYTPAQKQLMQDFHEKYGYENLTKEQLQQLHEDLDALQDADGNAVFEFKDADGNEFTWEEKKDD